MNEIKEKLMRYMDAGLPILYINTFEEDKVDSIIEDIVKASEIYEWNESKGYIDFENKTEVIEDCDIDMMLDVFSSRELLDRKVVILKDIAY